MEVARVYSLCNTGQIEKDFPEKAISIIYQKVTMDIKNIFIGKSYEH